MNRHNLSKDEPIPFRWFALTVLWLLCHTDVSTCFQPPTRMIRHRASSTLYYAFSLTSALESCIGDKDILPWINTTDNTDVDDDIDSSHCRTVPLYPLAACYLPTGQHQLRNIEPRNLKMANDLGINGRFCVVCSAVDTGRIAAVGTMFRILHMDPQTDPVSGQLLRILLTCEAEDLVNIRAIQNPKAAKWENRLQHSEEYLMATVCSRPNTTSNPQNNIQQLNQAILEDYNRVSHMYRDGTGAETLPPFTRERLEFVLPTRSAMDDNEASFWQMAQDWQTLCYTVREGHQIRLMSDRNELLIDAAIAKGGPLNLPVHVEDLLLEDRQKVQELEVVAQQQWLSLQLDPTMDFQVLLSLETYEERLQYFANMVHRERNRPKRKERC
ncbi:hypothetical protein FisN_6Hh149 [Fistulifera solaris]|uniref:Lon N-terminal domain-containing protein n=1 Tax=Fistulifera solaris TaxID=1519565 RepID=A0A1Z5JNE4_FISSO|nr:hypothetical protein FisN_6Hh149 [Fistulifera solaris]|eukprot:GAX15553.1 hypothetical protein FisN_6Hh149 [Fistulifera solaris]